MHRRHPLLSVEIGTSIDESASTCSTLHFGIFQDWILRALWLFVDFDLPDTGRQAESQILKDTQSRVRRMLSDRCPVYENKLGENKVTRIASVFNNLMGTLKRGTSCLSSWMCATEISFKSAWTHRLCSALLLHMDVLKRSALLRHPQRSRSTCWSLKNKACPLCCACFFAEKRSSSDRALFMEVVREQNVAHHVLSHSMRRLRRHLCISCRFD